MPDSGKGGRISKKPFTPEDIIGHLRTVEIESGKGVAVQDACRKLGICEQTYYR
jgi:putative transposase